MNHGFSLNLFGKRSERIIITFEVSYFILAEEGVSWVVGWGSSTNDAAHTGCFRHLDLNLSKEEARSIADPIKLFCFANE